jgi:hypothetical protein
MANSGLDLIHFERIEAAAKGEKSVPPKSKAAPKGISDS